MKKIILLLTISVFIISCSSNNDTQTDTDKISSYKHQIKELEQKIIDIEKANAGAEYTGLKIPVKVETISAQPFSHEFIAAGELESISEAFISPEINGQIIAIAVNEGQHVKKGQLLARLNTVLIDKSIIELEAKLDLALTINDKQTQLWEKGIGSELQYLQAKSNFETLSNSIETLKAQKDLATIKSPIDGIIEEIFQKTGELAAPGMQLMQIVDLDELFVSVQLSEAYLPIVKKGDVVNVTFPSYPGLNFEEKVYRTGNVINKQNRTFVVQIKINNKNGELKPNMLANITINDYNSLDAIVLPSIIIREDMIGSFIFVVGEENGNNIAVKKYIVPGRSFKDKTEIVDGLAVGDKIITEGYNNISKDAVIRIIEN